MKRSPVVLRRFLVGYLLVHLLAAGLFVWFLTRIVRDQIVDGARSRMQAVAQMLAQHIEELPQGLTEPTLPDHVQRLGQRTGYRFTLIDEQGRVICDSSTGTRDIGDHGSRPEVIQARDSGWGFSERFSRTVQQPMLYVALRLSDQDFVRVAAPAAAIHTTIRSMQLYVWGFAVVLALLTVALMTVFVTRLLRPLNEFVQMARQVGQGQTETRIAQLDRNDEWALLADAFHQMQMEIQSRERDIRESVSRLEAVLSSMIEGVIATDAQAHVRLANQAACQMLGVRRQELVGRSVFAQVRYPELAQAIESAQRDAASTTAEFQTRSPGRKTIRARVAPLVSDAEQRGPAVAIVLHDVTELRQLETMRRDFVANVSHELKTPLASIMAYAETLKLDAAAGRPLNTRFLQQIETQAQHLNQQIRDLLHLARVESGSEVWEIAPVSVNQIGRQTVQRFQGMATARQIRLNFHPDPADPLANADREGLVTILQNLISNAIHYTSEGGAVDVRVGHEEDEVYIDVADTGLGIAAEHQQRIFERFYRVDKARSREIGGTGLGLSIVKHLVAAFGGTVRLESQLGRGSTFQVRLPRSGG